MALLIKQFVNHFGLDLKSSDITRPKEYSSGMMNARYRKDGNISKREGYQAKAESQGGAGLARYTRINTETAQESDIILSISDKLSILELSTISVDYSGSETSCIFELFFDTVSEVYRAQIVEGTDLILNYSLGIGFDEASPITLADLKTQIDLLTDFSATITGSTTIPAAFLDLVRSHNLFGASSIIEARSWVDANAPLVSYFPGNITYKNDDDFEVTSWTQLNNVIYFGNGYDEIIKFDGQNAYRAGLPKSAALIAAVNGAGALTGTYFYFVVYSQFDAAGNLVESNISDPSNTVTPAAQSIDVTYTNILANSGFNTNCAITDGVQAGVNIINVDDGSAGAHTLKVGDTAYFFDGVSGEYVEREVTNTTANTITIAGAAVDVADNIAISNNLRVGIYRTLKGGTVGYLVEERPNDSFDTINLFNDNVPDSNLGIELLVPISDRDLPPKGRYVASYNNQLFIAGNLENPNFAYWTPPGEPEHFDQDSFNLRFQSPNGDKITGLKQSNEVMSIFEAKAIHIMSGDIPQNQIRVDTISKDIGCVAHASIQEVRGLLYFLGNRGVYTTVSGQIPKEVSGPVEPAFDINGITDQDRIPVLKRAIAVNHREKEQYILFVPTESELSGDKYANSFSKVLVQDYYRQAWLIWDNINAAGGMVYSNEQVLFSEKRNSAFEGSIQNVLYIQSNRGDNWDYNDNAEAVNCEYASSWYDISEPSVFKKFLRFKLFGTEQTDRNVFSVSIDIEKDYVSDQVIGNFTIDFGDNASGYGISPYGVSPYGDVVDPNRKVKIGPIKSKSIRFNIKNDNMLENIDITGWELEVQTPFRPTIKE